MSKKLQKGSQYEQFDLDGDGIVSDEELSRSEHMIRLENSDKMQDQQRMLCWVSSISSIILIVILHGTDIQENVYFSDLNTCLQFAEKIRAQNTHQQTAFSQVYVTTYCVPKTVPKEKGQ